MEGEEGGVCVWKRGVGKGEGRKRVYVCDRGEGKCVLVLRSSLSWTLSSHSCIVYCCYKKQPLIRYRYNLSRDEWSHLCHIAPSGGAKHVGDSKPVLCAKVELYSSETSQWQEDPP